MWVCGGVFVWGFWFLGFGSWWVLGDGWVFFGIVSFDLVMGLEVLSYEIGDLVK